MRRETADKRRILEEGTILHFEGMDCTVLECLGKGSNAIVYKGYYPDHYGKDLKHPVLIKELFPFHPSGGIFRDEEGRIQADPGAEDYFAMHRNSFENGNRFHLGLLKEHPSGLDSNMNTFAYQNTLYSILEFTGGRSLLDEMKAAAEDVQLDRMIGWMKGMLRVLELFHDQGYLHLDISPDNILLTGDGEQERVTLIDYNSVVSIEEIHQDEEILLSIKEDYAAPELLRAERNRIGTGTDLYAVASVFFFLLFGRSRTRIERKNRFVLPKTQGIPALDGQTPVVLDMLQQILKKGFENHPGRRYQTVEEMLLDLQELQERIRLRGITKWALWQAGFEQVRKTVRENRAFGFIGKEDSFPMYVEKNKERVRLAHAGVCSPQVLLGKPAAEKRKPILLLGGGGMGKTTALFSMILNRKYQYHAQMPAWVYVSLYGWKSTDRTFIMDKLLEGLRFQPHTDSMESARHELRRLLETPQKEGMPVLVLLLDGLNEAEGDTRALLEEIEELGAMEGVVLIASSRSAVGGNLFEEWRMSRLQPEEVKEILSGKGIIPPENEETLQMLTIPMMLSMYIQVVEENGRQNQKPEQKENLLEAYLSSLLDKEKKTLAPGDAYAYGVEAAVKYVLPEIAGALKRSRHPLTTKEMRELSERCYRNLSSRALTVVFEEWYGHARELRLDAGSADEWFGKVVLEILWRKLGLLVREEVGGHEEGFGKEVQETSAGSRQIVYRIRHQMLEEYLADRYLEFRRAYDRIRLRQKRWGTIAGLGLVSLLSAGFGIYNYRMRSKIQEQKSEIARQLTQVQRNESIILARDSENYFREMRITDAIESALHALPVQAERPYEAAAEKALTEAAGIYREPDLEGICRLECQMQMLQILPSADGRYVVSRDRFGNLYGFSGIDGEMRWRLNGCEPRSCSIIEGMDAVLYVGRTKMELLRLDTGEVLWTTVFEKPLEVYASYDPVQCNVSAGGDRIAAVRYDERGAWYEFYDVKTGKRRACTPVIAYQTEGEEEITEGAPAKAGKDPVRAQFLHTKGAFSADGSVFTTFVSTSGLTERNGQQLPRRYADRDCDGEYVLWLDTGSGECLGCVEVTNRADLSENMSFVWVEGSERVPENVLFFSRSEENELLYMECLSADENMNFTERFEAEDSMAPYVFSEGDDRLIASSGEILRLGMDGEIRMRISLPRKLVFCQRLGEGQVRFFLEDGRFYTADLSDLTSKVNLIGEEIREFSDINGSMVETQGILPFENVKVYGSDQPGAALCCMDQENPQDLYVYADRGDPNGIRISGELVMDGSLNRLPEEKGILYQDWELLHAEDESLLMWNTLGLYDFEKLRYETLLDTVMPCAVGRFLGISGDDRFLLFENGSFDRSLGEWIDEAYAGPEERTEAYEAQLCDPSILFTDQDLIGMDQMILSMYLDTDELYWQLNGEKKTVSLLKDGVNIQDLSGKEKGSSDLVRFDIGDNGVLVYSVEDSRAVDTDAKYHYEIYTDETKTWQTLCSGQGAYQGEAVFAMAQKAGLLAAAENDWKIHVIDPAPGVETGVLPMEFPVDLLLDMEFVQEDAFLLLGYLDPTADIVTLEILDALTGEKVWSCRANDPAQKENWKGIRVYEDPERQELYLYEESGNGTGYVLDLSGMEVKRTIPRLYAISDQQVITRAKDNKGFYRYPRYTLEEICGIGRGLLGLGIEDSESQADLKEETGDGEF